MPQNIPKLGNGIDYRPFGLLQDEYSAAKKDYDSLENYIDGVKQHPLYRIGVDRNIDPEIARVLGGLLGVQSQVNDGRLSFHTEIPGFNSNRYYLGMNWRF